MGGRTKGTRPKGSGIPAGGPGWGGAAKDNSNRAPIAPQITSENAAEMAAKAHTPEAAAKREAKIASLEEIKETLTDIMRDGKAPHMARIHAGDKLADRIEGKARQAVELTGKDGDPMKTEVIRRVIIDPKAAE